LFGIGVDRTSVNTVKKLALDESAATAALDSPINSAGVTIGRNQMIHVVGTPKLQMSPMVSAHRLCWTDIFQAGKYARRQNRSHCS